MLSSKTNRAKTKLTRSRVAAVLIAVCLMLGIINVPAADVLAADVSVTIALSASSVSIGQSVTATVSVSGSTISAYTLYVSYSSDILQYSSGSGATINGGGGAITISGTGAGSSTLSFSAIANGSASIATSGEDFFDINYNYLSVSHASVLVTVQTTEATTQATTESTTEATTKQDSTESSEDDTEATTEDTTEDTTEELSSDYLLSSLAISPGELSPEFDPYTAAYDVTLEAGTTSVIVSAETSSDKATVNVAGSKSLVDGKNTVTVTVTAENGAVKIYTLNVQVGDVVDTDTVTIGDVTYTIVKDGYYPDYPQDFTYADISYKGEQIQGCTSANGKLSLLCLMDEGGNKAWYIYDDIEDTFTLYKEYTANDARYVILPKPIEIAVPDGYKPTTLTIGEEDEAVSYEAYTDGASDDIYLIYAMNVNGDAGFYFYDKLEGSFMRFDAATRLMASLTDADEETKTEAVTTESTQSISNPVVPEATTQQVEEKGLFSNVNTKKLLAVMSALFLMMCIIVIVLLIKNNRLMNGVIDLPEVTREEDDFDSMATEDTSGETAADKSAATADESATAAKSTSYTVGDDTGEIQLEAADDNNSSVNVPPVEDVNKRQEAIEKAKQEKPYGIDSAFDVVQDDRISQLLSEVHTDISGTKADAEVTDADGATVSAASETKTNVKSEPKKTRTPEKEPDTIVLPSEEEED